MSSTTANESLSTTRSSDHGDIEPITAAPRTLDAMRQLRAKAATNRAMRAHLIPFGLGATVTYVSIIGHELQSGSGLLEWFLAQRESCRCYTRAIFSGFCR